MPEDNPSVGQRVYLRIESRISLLKKVNLTAIAFILLSIFGQGLFRVSDAYAATNDTLTFQARLLQSSGALVPDGNYNVEFKLYDAPSGGTLLWTEDYLNQVAGNDVVVKNGYIYANLGSVTSFPAIDWDQALWLTMNVGNTNPTCTPFSSCSPDGEMSPRFKLTAVPYAFKAAQAANVASAATSTASTNSNNVVVVSGNATGTTSNSGSITIDAGTATGTTGALLFGTSNASALTIGRSGVTTTLQGSISVTGAGTGLAVTNDATIGGTLGVTGLATFNGGLTVIAGKTFTNAGATLNTSLAISNKNYTGSGNTGSIGSAASTVDVATTFDVSQTTAGQTLTLASPTVATSGRIVYVNNVGSQAFTMYGSNIAAGGSSTFIWNGSAWVTTLSLTSTVVNAVGTIDTQTKSADGAVISGNQIFFQTADNTHVGLISASAQTIGGDKSLTGKTTLGGGSNQTQLIVKANSGQTFANPLILLQDSLGAELARINVSSSSLYFGNGAGGSSASGANNVAVGASALGVASTGAANTTLGSGALASITTASNNTAVGYNAGNLLTGANNILLGYQAGSNLTTGANNIIIGYNLGASAGGVSNELRIGGVLQGDTSTLAATFNGALTSTGLFTGNLGATVSGATISLNASSNFNTNINTGTSTGTVAIGNSASTTTVLGATNINTTGAATTTIGNATGAVAVNGATTFGAAGTALTVTNNATISGTLLVSSTSTFTGLITANGGLTVATNQPFTNNGKTTTSALALSPGVTGSAIGTAAATVDVRSGFAITPNAGTPAYTIPSPTAGVTGQTIYIQNASATLSFTINGATFAPGSTATYIWDNTNTAWRATGIDTGVTSVGAINGTSTANGASITGTILNLAVADGTNGGVLSAAASAQTIGGAKTFSGAVTVQGLLSGTAGATISGATISLNDSSNFNTTINTGTSTGNVTVGNSSNAANTVTVVAGGTNGIRLQSSNVSIGAAAGSGLFTNNGATQFTTSALGDLAAGPIGTAGATVDVYSSFTISPTASGRTYTIPTPTSGTGRLIYISNINASNTFIIGATTFASHSTATFVYDGTSWNFAGMDGGSNNYIQNQNATDQVANFRIGGNGVITPTANSAVGLTVNGTTGTAATALVVAQSGAANGLTITSSNASQVGQSGLSVTQSGTSTGFTGNFINFVGSSTTGSGNTVNITGVNTTAGNTVNVTNNALTTGNGVNINHTTSVITSGSLFTLNSTAADAFTTGALATISSAGNFTSTANTAGLLNVSATATTAGTLVNIASSAAGQTASTLLNVVASGYTTGYNGNVANFTGVSTTGAANVVNISSANTTAGNALNVTANGLTTGTALNVNSTGALTTTGNIATFTANSATTATGVVAINATGLTTGAALNITATNSTLALNATGKITVSGLGTFSSALTVGSGTGVGLFTNNGATSFTSSVLGDLAAGPLGTAAATVDVYTSFTISPTASGRTYTIPAPTAGNAGRLIYISNINATNTFIIGSTTFGSHSTATFIYDGTNWNFAGMDGGSNNYIQNQNATDQTSANFRISGTGQATTSFISPLFDALSGGALSVGTSSATSVTVGSTTNTTAVALQGAVVATYDIGTATGTGTINLGKSTAGQIINIGGALVATGNTQTIHIGDSATGTGKDVITIGNANGNSSVNIQSAGTGGLTLGATTGNIALTTTTSGTITVTSAGTFALASTNLQISTAGVITLAGGQTQDITTPGTGTSNGITVQPGTSTVGSGTGATLTLKGGGQSGATSTGGSVIIDAGTGTTSNGGLTLGTTNAASIGLGHSGITTTITGGLTQLTGAVSLTGNAASQFSTTSGNLTFDAAATLNLGTTTTASVVIGNTANNASVLVQGTAGATYTIGTANNTGGIVLGNSTDTNTIAIGNGNTLTGKVQTINIGNGTPAGTGLTNIVIGNNVNAGSTTIQSATTNINSGTIATSATTLGLFNTNAATVTALQVGTSISIGATTGTLTVRNANTTLGNAAGSGTFTNNGSTAFSTSALGDLAAGPIGTAAATVDVYTSFTISPTASGRTYTIPAPTSGTAGRLIYISNINATNTFIIGATTFGVHSTATFIYDGTSWNFAGMDGGSNNYIQNQSATDQVANFRIGGNGIISPTANSAVALTVNGTTGTAATALAVAQTGAANGLTITSSNVSQVGQSGLSVTQSGTSTGFTGNFVNFVGSSTTGAGNTLSVTGVNTTAGNTVNVTNNAVTTGNGVNINHTTSAITTGSLLTVNSSAADAFTTGSLANISSSGNFTSTANTSGLLNVSATASTAGTLLNVANSAAGQTTSTLLNVVASGYTTGYTGNVANFTGVSTTGAANVVNITTANTTAGAGLNLTANGITTGIGANLSHATSSITTGALLKVSSTVADGYTTGGLAVVTSNANFTSTANTGGLLNITASATTAGTLVNIANSAAGQTTSTLLNVVASGYTTGYTGNVANFTGVSTTGAANVLNVTSANTTAGNALNVTANGLTTGTALNVNSTGTLTTTGNIATFTANSASTATGVVTISATGLTTGAALNIIATNSTLALNATGGGSFSGALSVGGLTSLNGNTVIGDATTDRLTVTSQILGASPLVFQGATDDSFTTTLAITDPTGTSKTITLPNATGTVLLTTGSSSFGLAKDAADTSTAAVAAAGYLYGFTNSSSAVASGVLKVDNGNNTGIGILSTATAGTLLSLQNSASTILDVTAARVGNFNGTNAGQFNFTSDMTGGARSTNFVNITQNDNATNSSTGSLLTVNQLDTTSNGSAAVYVDQEATNGVALSVFSAGQGVQVGGAYTIGVNLLTLLNATGVKLGQVTSGIGIDYNGSAGTSSTAFTGTLLNITPASGHAVTSGTQSDTGNYLKIGRTNSASGATSVLNVTGALASLSSTCSASSGGTCNDSSNVLSLTQSYAAASGAVLNITNAGAGTGLAVTQTGAATAATISQTSVNNGLVITSTNAAQVSTTALSVTQSGTSTGFTGNFINFVGSSTTGTGNLLNLTAVNTTAGNALNVTSNAVTSGNVLNINHTTSALTTGTLLTVTSTAADAFTTGALANISSSGNFTSAANTAGLLNVLATATADGTLVNIANSYASQATSTALNVVQTATTTGYTGNFVNFVGSSTTGAANLLNLTSVNTTAGNALNVTTNAITSGNGVNINHSAGSAITSGSLLKVTSSGSDAFTTGSLVNISSTGNFTTTALTSGLLSVTANNSTTGTLVNLYDNSAGKTTGSVLSIVSSGYTTGYTGNVVNIDGASTTGVSNVLNITSQNTTAGTALKVTANGLTTGTGFSLNSGGTIVTTGSLATLTANSATTATGVVTLNATGLTTGSALNIIANNSANAIKALGNFQFAQGGARTLSVETTNTNAVGSALTISAGAAGTGASAFGGGILTLQGGAAAGTGNANGGGLALTGGTGVGTGVLGLVSLAPTTFLSSGSAQSSAVSFTVANVDTYSTIAINATATSVIATVPVPNAANQLTGRILYITAANGTNDFTLSLANTSGSVPSYTNITMKANNTATLIWNGFAWTAAGASSATDLQAAYNNTATSAGGAELILNAAGGAADGLTIRNNATSPIIGTATASGGLLEVQTSIGSNLFTVNNNAVEYATNGGAETAGGSSTTFPASAPTWATIAGTATAAISRDVTSGEYATGQASAKIVTTGATTAGQGIANALSVNGSATALTTNLQYTVSFTVKGTSNFSTLDVSYSKDGTTSGLTTCATGQTVTQSIWTRINCTFIAPASITSSNAIMIRQSDSNSSSKTFYVDNLSVTVNANVNHAADGSADTAANIGAGTLNWAAVGGTTVAQTTSVLYDTSGSVNVTGAGTGGTKGVYNKLSNNIAPQINTQYRVSFYSRGDSTNGLTESVSYTPDNGTTNIACQDYNTQTVAASSYTLVSCLFTTGATTVTNAQIRIVQATGTGTQFYVDALTVTLNSNNANNVQIGGANKGGPVTLLTLDRSAGAPIAANNDAYLGSMYYDTSSGRIQCYEADGWGACGAAPDNIVNLNPEYAGAVLDGTGVGTMTSDFCSNDAALSINSTLCSTGQAKNFYKWTSPQATQQTYSIYVTYQLPATFNGFSSDDTVQLVGRVDNTTNASVTYQMYKSTGAAVTQCGSGETNVITGGGGSANTWYSYGINGNESTGCSFNSSSSGNFVIFKINLKANSGANAYVSTLSFTTTGR